jgi:hypothetical protein
VCQHRSWGKSIMRKGKEESSAFLRGRRHLYYFFTLRVLSSWVPVVHMCNPSYLGGWDLEDLWLEASPEVGCSSWEPISTYSWTLWHIPVIPSYMGDWAWEEHCSMPAWTKKKKKNCETPNLNRKKLTVVMCTCHPSYGRKFKIGGSQSRLAWAKGETLSPKQPEQRGLKAWLEQ